jgi:hypothetical protein
MQKQAFGHILAGSPAHYDGASGYYTGEHPANVDSRHRLMEALLCHMLAVKKASKLQLNRDVLPTME